MEGNDPSLLASVFIEAFVENSIVLIGLSVLLAVFLIIFLLYKCLIDSTKDRP